jgi:hypothetical protein
MKIKVSHESPLSLLDESLQYNDYCYALVHLFDQYPEYYNFFKNAMQLHDKQVYLDNSIFELGKSFDPDEYAKWIKQLEPSVYIVPDTLEESKDTIKQYYGFLEKFPDLPGKRMGVVQGKTYDDLTRCYSFMSEYADMIAISFDYSYYLSTGTGNSRLERYMTGRQKFIRDLINENRWNWDKPVHLLGCSLAREFSYYVDRNIYNIKSCDTSNPVVAAMFNLKYNDTWGLDEKPKQKLADMVEANLDDTQLEILYYNLSIFKKIVGWDV